MSEIKKYCLQSLLTSVFGWVVMIASTLSTFVEFEMLKDVSGIERLVAFLIAFGLTRIKGDILTDLITNLFTRKSKDL